MGGKSLLNSGRKAFAIGFIIDFHSIYGLAKDLLLNISKPLKYFLTYKCSQDHIELYFCCIRSRGGWNNNPTVLQALWTIRRLLYRNSVTPSKNANCLIDNEETSSILDFRSKKRKIMEEPHADSNKEIEDLMTRLESTHLSAYQKNILFYIGGYIVYQFNQNCTCSYCRDIVNALQNDHDYVGQNHSQFSNFVNRGKLCTPSNIVFDIIQYCEKSFKTEVQIGFYGSINLKDRMTSLVIA